MDHLLRSVLATPRRLALLMLHLTLLGSLAAAAVACTPARGSGGSSNKCTEDDDCDIGDYCDIDDGASKGRCRPLGGGVGANCSNTSDCSSDLRCLAGDQICVKTCETSVECGGAACIPVADAGIGYCDIVSTNNNPNNGTNNNPNNGTNNNPNNGTNNNPNNGTNTGACTVDAECEAFEECCDGDCVNRGTCNNGCIRDTDCGASEECCNAQCAPRGTCDPCGGRCTASQQCINGSCVNDSLPVCQFEGQPCDQNTEGTDTLTCFAGDNLEPDTLTCHAVCRDEQNSSDCPSGSFCAGLVDANGDPVGAACFNSNCTSPTRSATECSAASPSGGTCFPTRNNGFYCNPAGTGRRGATCTEVQECASGLSCVFGECQPLCTLRGSTAPCPSPLGCVDLLDDPTWGLCTDDCAGFSAAANECPSGQGCLPLTTTTGLCTEVGTSPARSACNPDAASPECVALTTCTQFTDAVEATCNPLCDLGAANPEARCAADELCIPSFSITDETGVCTAGCNPTSAANGCTQPGLESCLAITPTRGVCIDSGTKTPGQACNLIGGSIFGDCGDNSACVPNDPNSTSTSAPGICEELCVNFSSVNNYSSGCPAGDVCEIYGTNWGVCTSNVLSPQLEPFEPCFDAGTWCSDDNLCLEVDTAGNAVCVPLCRLGSPQGDDCRGKTSNGSPSSCQAVLQSEALGACL